MIINEKSSANARFAYARSKKAGEELCLGIFIAFLLQHCPLRSDLFRLV